MAEAPDHESQREPEKEPQRRTSVSSRLLGSMMKGSLLFAHAAWLVSLGVGFAIGGPLGLANAAVGGALVVAFFAVGQGLQMLAGELDPRTGMGITLTSFLIRAALLAGLLVLVSRADSIEAVFRPTPFIVGVLVVLVGWLTGMFVTHARLRIPVYDHQDDTEG